MEVPKPHRACFGPCQCFQSSKGPGNQWNLHLWQPLLEMQGYDNKPSFPLKPIPEHKKEQKGKWISVLHQSVSGRATVSIPKTTENQAGSRRDKTQHSPRGQCALPAHQAIRLEKVTPKEEKEKQTLSS